MTISTLEAISPLDGRYREKIKRLANYFSEHALIKYRVKVEIRWFESLCNEKKIHETPTLSDIQKRKLNSIIENFSLTDSRKIKLIEKKTNHDVKAVEYWLQDRIKKIPGLEKYTQFIHFACTSEDINNCAHSLMLKESRDKEVMPIIDKLIAELTKLAKKNAHVAMASRTHGQLASPTTLGKEIANFVYRLREHQKTIKNVYLSAKANGAVGNFNAHLIAYPKVNWQSLSKKFISNLGLKPIAYTTQIEPHDSMAELFDGYKRFNSTLLDLNKDFWSYISLGYFGQKLVTNEVGSSTMPHKINPIDFENSEGNLGIANSLFTHLSQKLLVSRLQRDLSDSTALRNNGAVLGYSILAYLSTLNGIKKVKPNYAIIKADLADRWELLSEPIQTTMKRYGAKNAYEILKNLTRGNSKISEKQIHKLINGLSIPKDEKNRLLNLNPESYIGFSERLAKKI